MSQIKELKTTIETMIKKGANQVEIDTMLAEAGLTYNQFLDGVQRLSKTGGKKVDAGFGRLIVQGLTLGFGDEIEAWAKSLKGEDYKTTRNAIRYGISDYRKQNPGTALTGEVVGSLAPTIGAMILAPFTGGSSTAAVAPGLARLFSKSIIGGTATGAASGLGAAEGTASEQAKKTMQGGALGGFTGPLTTSAIEGVKAVGRMARPLVSRQFQRDVVGDVLNASATNPAAARRNLQTAPEYVPQSAPTTSQASGDLGLAGLQTPVRSNFDPSNRIAQRLSEQNEARQRVVGRLSGQTPETIARAKVKRDAITGPMREGAFRGSAIPDKMIPSGYTLTVTKKIDDLLASPAGKRKTVAAALNDAKKQIPKADNIRDLYEIRKDLRLASLGKLSGPRQDHKLAKGQLEDVIREIDNVIESAAPGYRSYLNRYRNMSRPINQMETLQDLRRKSALAGPDPRTGDDILSQAKFKSQVQALPPDVLSQSQTRQINDVLKDLNRSVAPVAPNVQVPGSATAKNLVIGGMAERIFGNPGNVANAIMNKFARVYNMPENLTRQLLVDAMLDPRLASDLMGEASESAMRRVEKALQSQLRQTATAASVGTMGGLLVNQ